MTTKKNTAAKAESEKPKKSGKPKAATTPVIVTGYKGFDKNMQCRGMQYEVGKMYEVKEASLCNTGLHFCEYPLDCLGYYEPGLGSRYAEVSAENPSTQTDGDSKRVTKKLTIGAELSFGDLAKAAVQWTWKQATKENAASETNSATQGNWANSATQGEGANSATQGAYSKSAAMGLHSVAASFGYAGQAKACLGSWIVLTERNNSYEIIAVRCAQIDGEVLKPDVYYMMKDGEFVEVEA